MNVDEVFRDMEDSTTHNIDVGRQTSPSALTQRFRPWTEPMLHAGVLPCHWGLRPSNHAFFVRSIVFINVFFAYFDATIKLVK